jgi:hypothetical protein
VERSQINKYLFFNMEDSKKDLMFASNLWWIKPVIVFFVLLLVFCLGVEFGKHNFRGGYEFGNYGVGQNMFYRYNSPGTQNSYGAHSQRRIVSQNNSDAVTQGGNAVQQGAAVTNGNLVPPTPAPKSNGATSAAAPSADNSTNSAAPATN